MGLWRKRAFAVVGKESGKQRYRLLGSSHCCGGADAAAAVEKRLLRVWTLLRQFGSRKKGSCGSGYCCGSEEVEKKAPAVAGTAVSVRK
ncbi:hypothetical protein ROHU_009999 [Labeo rohita]|uniref:Uncharacterized protein n=1 Tax=Labeo rohita TaxID=84645 RepID=A0A498LX17_LABRO|nr:hypothetical protein ROHU_009999 [Labeo rohita]